MKEKIKPMAIYGGSGAALGAVVAYFMKKRDIKSMLIFAGVGLAAGAVTGYLLGGTKSEFSNASGQYNTCDCKTGSTVSHWTDENGISWSQGGGASCTCKGKASNV